MIQPFIFEDDEITKSDTFEELFNLAKKGEILVDFKGKEKKTYEYFITNSSYFLIPDNAGHIIYFVDDSYFVKQFQIGYLDSNYVFGVNNKGKVHCRIEFNMEKGKIIGMKIIEQYSTKK